MPKIARIPITNIYADGDYTGRILVGPKKKPMNVLFDTGSSSFALNFRSYRPDIAGGDKTTRLAQFDSYDDHSGWTGAVIKTTITIGRGSYAVTASGINAAVAYRQHGDMFGKADGILGLAYAPLDQVRKMPCDTWSKRYAYRRVIRHKIRKMRPCLTQLAREGVVSDRISFYTRRSAIHVGGGGAKDPLNRGWMIIGGGEEAHDLYTGTFQTVKVLTDDYYNTNLKAVIVGNTPPIPVPRHATRSTPSNSIVDSGTASLDLGPRLLKRILANFSAGQRALLSASISETSNRSVAMSRLDLKTWPDLVFVLQGVGGDVRLKVRPRDYWQVNAPRVGRATAAITAATGPGSDSSQTLGLPLMNGYFTIFDGEADHGRGVIKFATRK